MTRKELCNLLLWTDNGKKTDEVTVRLWNKDGEKKEIEIIGVSVSGKLFIDVTDRGVTTETHFEPTKFSYATIQCGSISPSGRRCELPEAHGGYHYDGRIDF